MHIGICLNSYSKVYCLLHSMTLCKLYKLFLPLKSVIFGQKNPELNKYITGHKCKSITG